MGQLQEIESQLQDLGYQIIAASPDRPEKLRESSNKHRLNYRLVSDSSQEAALAFGLAFQISDEAFRRYQGLGIDLEDASGHTHHILPVPAVYLIGADGLVRFMYVNPNHTVRLHPEILLAAARVHAR